MRWREEQPAVAAGHMPDLDGLRAIAVSLVLVEHFVAVCVPAGFVQNLCWFGWSGVDLFFVISGFLIGGILLDHRSAANYYRVFYIRRFFRIIPLYALLLAPLAVVLLLGWQNRFAGHGLEAAGWGTVLLYVFFQQNLGNHLFFATPGYLGPAWSLAIEEQFYLLLPPLVRRLTRASLLKLIVAAIVTAPLLRTALVLGFPAARWARFAPTMLLPCRWDVLLLGLLVACLIREAAFQDWISKRLGWLRAACLVLGLGVSGMALAGWHTDNRMIATWGYSWLAVFFSAVLLLSRVHQRGRVCRWLSWPGFKPIATISYGLYLIQGPTLAVRQSILVERLHWTTNVWNSIGVNLLTLAVTIVLAALSWKFFESRMLRHAHHQRFR
jgi:peptidoglycan/LPS O-acetylase OafA/YrhL